MAAILFWLLVAHSGCTEDFTGGTKLTYRLDMSDVDAEPSEVADAVRRTVIERLDIFGTNLPVEVDRDQLVVKVPPVDGSSLAALKQLIGHAGKLDLLLVAPAAEQTPERIREVEDDESRYRKEQLKRTARTTPPAIIARPGLTTEKNAWGNHLTILHDEEAYRVSGRHLTFANCVYDEAGRPCIDLAFDQEGATRLAQLTQANRGRLLALVLDDRIHQVVGIHDTMSGSARITGSSREEVRIIAILLKGGSLPVKPRLISESPIGQKRP